MRYTPVSADQFAQMEGLDDWQLREGVLHADFRAGSFSAAAAFVPAIGAAADAIDHHPDIDVRYPDHVRITLTTHAVRGLTTHDTDLARTISLLAAAAGASATKK